MTTQELSAALITVFEGERLSAYQDSGGVWTIGIGHTEGVTRGMVITHEQAIRFFSLDQASLFQQVMNRPMLEAAALLSFGFNCGHQALAKVMSGADSISNIVHTTDRHGQQLAGLVSRRRLEMALIETSKTIMTIVTGKPTT